MPNAKPVTKRDPAAPAPTPKPPKVGSLPKPPKPPKPKATQAGVSVTGLSKSRSPKGEDKIVHEVGDFWVSHEGPGLFHVNQSGLTHSTKVGTYHFADRPEYAKDRAIANAEERASKRGKIAKSEPTAILDAARVDAEVERRLAEIEGAREGLSKAGWGKMTPDTPEKQAAYDAGDQAEEYGRIAHNMMADPRTLPDLATYQNAHQQAAQAARNAAAKHREAGDFVDAASRFEQAAAAHDRFGRPEHHAALQASAAIWQPEQRPKDPQATATKYRNAAAAWRKAGYEKTASGLEAEAHAIGRTPIAKSESDHVKEFVLGLDLGGTRRWHSACVSKDDSNLGKAIKGKQADRTYSREGSRGVPGICTGCGGELQMDPAPREVDAPVHGEDHNEHKIEKAEPKMKMPKYTEGRGWTGGEKDRLYHLTDKRTGQKWVKDIGNMRGTGPEVEVRHATRAEAEEMHQKPLHPGWKVSESVEKGYDEIIKEKHGMGPGGKSASRLNKAFYKEPGQGRFENVVFQQGDDADEALQIADEQGEEAAVKHLMQWHNPGEHETSDESSAGEDDFTFESEHHPGYVLSYRPSHRYIGLEFDTHKGIAKSELLAGARHHYARVVRFQQLGKSEEVAKSAAMCALYVAKMGADPSKDVPAEVRNCGPVDLASASFHLDREVRGLPAKMLPLIKSRPIQKALTGAPGDTAPGATMDGGALQLAEDAKHGAKEVCAECKQPISYHQHSRKWNHSNTQDSEKPHQSVRVRPEGWSSAWHKSVEKSEKSDVIGEVGKSGGKPLDIGDGIKDYHRKYHEKPVKKAENQTHTSSGKEVPDAASPLYSERTKFPKWNTAPSAADEPRLLAARTQGWTRRDHAEAAKIHAERAATLENQHSSLLEQGYGQHGGDRTRYVSGGHQEAWPDELKNKSRELSRARSAAIAASAAHHQLSGSRTPWRAVYGSDSPAKVKPEVIAAQKSECAPAGSPLEKLNAMIKGASGASLSKAARAPRPPQEHNEDHVRELHIYADLHRQMAEPIHRNLANKMASGQ